MDSAESDELEIDLASLSRARKRTGAKSRVSLDSLSRVASELWMELFICLLIRVNSSAFVLAWWWYIILTPVTTESLNLKLYLKEFFLFFTALLYLTSKSLIFWSNRAICWQAFSNFSLASVSFSRRWPWSIRRGRSRHYLKICDKLSSVIPNIVDNDDALI